MLRKRKSGFSEGQMIESLVVLLAIGGESPEDIRLINVADEFRNGNLPARQAPLTCAQME